MASRAQIGKQIRSARKAMGYAQKTLSEKIGINKTTIYEVENSHFSKVYEILNTFIHL